MAYTTVLLVTMSGTVVCSILGILHSVSVLNSEFSESLPIIFTICCVVAILDLVAVSIDRNDNKGMGYLLNGISTVCFVICILFTVALVICCVEDYLSGIGASCVCLAFFGIQFGCFRLASHKFKKIAPEDSEAYRRFRKCRFYAALLVAVIVLVTCAGLFAPEEAVHQVIGVFAGSFVSLMVFTQMVDVYMIEVPQEAKNQHDTSKIVKMEPAASEPFPSHDRQEKIDEAIGSTGLARMECLCSMFYEQFEQCS